MNVPSKPPVAPPEPTPEEIDQHLATAATAATAATEQVEKMLYPTSSMTEAGFSLNFSMLIPVPHSDPKLPMGYVPFSATFRRASIEEAEGAMPLVAAWVAARQKAGWRFNVPLPAPETKTDAIAREAGGQAAVDNLHNAQASAPLPSTPSGEPANTMRIVKLEIKQGKEAGRMSVLFFNDMAHNFADLQIQNWPNEKALGLLAPVMKTDGLVVPVPNSDPPVTLAMPQSFVLSCLAVWKDGQAYVNQKTKQQSHYKDVIELRPAPTVTA